MSDHGRGIGIGYYTDKRLREYDSRPTEGEIVVCKAFRFLPRKSGRAHRIHLEKRLKALGTTRDPRDLAVSMITRAEHLGQKWPFNERVTKEFPEWFGWFMLWADLGEDLMMVSRFEDYTNDLVGEVRRIAKHIGIKITKEYAERIGARYTKEAIMERKLQFFDDKRDGKRVKEDMSLPSVPGIVYGTSDLWQSRLKPKDVQLIEKSNRKYMERFGYL